MRIIHLFLLGFILTMPIASKASWAEWLGDKYTGAVHYYYKIYDAMAGTGYSTPTEMAKRLDGYVAKKLLDLGGDKNSILKKVASKVLPGKVLNSADRISEKTISMLGYSDKALKLMMTKEQYEWHNTLLEQLQRNEDNIDKYKTEIKEEDYNLADIIALFETQYLIIRELVQNILVASKESKEKLKKGVNAAKEGIKAVKGIVKPKKSEASY